MATKSIQNLIFHMISKNKKQKTKSNQRKGKPTKLVKVNPENNTGRNKVVAIGDSIIGETK